MSARVVAIVPSLGVSPTAERCLAALRSELASADGALVWVHQGDASAPVLDRPGEQLVALPTAVGFARAIHAGLAAAPGAPVVALVNDDLEVERGWLLALLEALAADPQLGSVQGVHRLTDDPQRLDGCGIAWNRWWQAVQLGHGELRPDPSTDLEVFGVSATAALYRQDALHTVEIAPGRPFDERLGTWYEDVELAVRLRAAGWRARCVVAARARHAGSATGSRRPFDRARRLAANRWLVLARLAGLRLPLLAPRAALRDGIDFGRAVLGGRWPVAGGLVAGWVTALLRLPRFGHLGRPRVDLREVERLRVGLPV